MSDVSTRPTELSVYMPDLVWRATVTGLLKELTAEVLALTEVVHEMAKKLEAQEKQRDI